MLNKELKNLFVDNTLNTEMMHGDCDYDPEYKYRKSWDKSSPDYEVMLTRVVSSGYGRDLSRMGVEWEEVDSYGGEDCGSTYYHVWKFTRDGESCYFRFDGWYASHYGADFQDVSEVTPQQKTVTEYV